ncbi:hypothetical protein [Aeromicrobium sp. UC242_57]|uniref:hypothetical protein n=1 Tax=Aeromicrobium sp. UC242_57 TaxID=3374624 RepID=UPI0037AD58C1
MPRAWIRRVSRSTWVTIEPRYSRTPGRFHNEPSPSSRSSGLRSEKNEVSATRSYGGRVSSPNTSMSHV